MAHNLSGFRCLLLTWRRSQSRRGLYGGGGRRGGHSGPAPSLFFPGFECHLSVWPTNAPRWSPLAQHPSASRVPEPGRVPLPHLILATPSLRSPPLRPPPPPPPQHRKKLPSSLSGISLSLLLGPQMRKTALPASGFPKKVRKFSEGTLSPNFLAKYLVAWCRNFQQFPRPSRAGATLSSCGVDEKDYTLPNIHKSNSTLDAISLCLDALFLT